MVAIATVESIDNTNSQSAISDYGKVVFVRQEMAVKDIAVMLEGIAKDQMVAETLTGLSSSATCKWPIGFGQFDRNRIGSKSSIGLYRSERLYDSFRLQDDVGNESELNPHPINANGQRYFETLKEAEMYYLYNRFIWLENYGRPSLEIIIEDRRGWFEEIFVGKSALKLVIGGNSLVDCEVKLLGRNPGLSEFYPADYVMQHGISLSNRPEELSVYLTLDNKVLDHRRVTERTTFFDSTEGVRFEHEERIINVQTPYKMEGYHELSNDCDPDWRHVEIRLFYK